MRVITGSARGRRLEEPAGRDIRPTTDLVKEAAFSIVQFDVEGRQVLDLFAGTGQLGIEALSRGAAGCVFVDRSRAAAELVRRNLKRCGFTAPVLQADSLAYLKAAIEGTALPDEPPEAPAAPRPVLCREEDCTGCAACAHAAACHTRMGQPPPGNAFDIGTAQSQNQNASEISSHVFLTPF